MPHDQSVRKPQQGRSSLTHRGQWPMIQRGGRCARTSREGLTTMQRDRLEGPSLPSNAGVVRQIRQSQHTTAPHRLRKFLRYGIEEKSRCWAPFFGSPRGALSLVPFYRMQSNMPLQQCPSRPSESRQAGWRHRNSSLSEQCLLARQYRSAQPV